LGAEVPALPPALQSEAIAAGVDLLAVYLAKIAAAEAVHMSVATSRGAQEEKLFRAAAAAVAETPVAGTAVTPARLAAAGLHWLMLLKVPWTALSPAQTAVVKEYAATTVRLTAAQRRWTGASGTGTVVVPAGWASLSPAAAVACLSQLQALGARWPALATHPPLTAALAELATVLLGTRDSAGKEAVDHADGDGDPRGVAPRRDRDRASARYAAGLEVVLRGLGGPPLVDL